MGGTCSGSISRQSSSHAGPVAVARKGAQCQVETRFSGRRATNPSSTCQAHASHTVFRQPGHDLRLRRRILGHRYSHVLVVRPRQPRQDTAGCPRITGDADHHGHVTVRGEHREALDRSGLVRGQRCTHARVGIRSEMAQHPGRRRRVPGRYRPPDVLPRVVQLEVVALAIRPEKPIRALRGRKTPAFDTCRACRRDGETAMTKSQSPR